MPPTLKIVPALCLAAACAGRPDAAATVEIEARPLSREAALGDSPAAVEGEEGAIEVRRTMRLADACRTLSAALRHAPGTLTLRVVAVPDGRACPAAESYLAYTARIEELPPGRYELRVEHAEAGRGAAVPGPAPVLVEERAVQVP